MLQSARGHHFPLSPLFCRYLSLPARLPSARKWRKGTEKINSLEQNNYLQYFLRYASPSRNLRSQKLTLCQITPRYSEELAASRDIMTRIQPNSGALTVSFTNNFMQLWLHQFKLKIFKKEKKATVKIKHFWLQQSEKNSFTSSGCETVCTFFTLSEGAEKQLREIWHIKASCIDVTPDTKAQDKRFRWPTMLKEGRWIAWQKQTNKSYRAVYQ